MKNKLFKILLVIFIFISIFCISFYLQIHKNDNIRLVNFYCKYWGCDSRVIKALIDVESSWKPKAISKKGCIGLMQVSPIAYKYYWQERAKTEKNKELLIYVKANNQTIRENLFIPKINICIGTWYFKYCLKKSKGNYVRAINLYISGNKDIVCWDYLNNIMNKVIKYNNK